ncbi:acetyl esterase/lipase [Mycobacterium sp. URHB0021]
MTLAQVAVSDQPAVKPTPAQWLIRQSGIRNRFIPVGKFDHWVTHPRAPYSGRPAKRLLRRVDVSRADVAGLPVYEVTPRLSDTRRLNGHLVYLHGGAYVMDFIPGVHWPVVARLACLLRRSITVPIYPLAPEYNYRAVFPFLLKVYQGIVDHHPPDSVVFAGDSAGGGMALALCHALRTAGLPQPRDALLLSPWMDVAFSDRAVDAVALIDPLLNVDHLRSAGLRYADGDPLDSPLVSPGAGPLAGLPRLTIFTGTRDVLNPDTRAFRARAALEGVDVGWHERENGAHCWMFLPGQASREAFDIMRRTVE